MIRGMRVLWSIGFHYVINVFKRQKYRVDNKELDLATKREYRFHIYRAMQDLSRRMVKAAGATIEIKGLFDSPVMAILIENEPVIFIGKEETKKMPVFGKWFEAMGCIYLARDDMKQSLQAILKGIDELKNGQSIVIFPEGTRMKGKEMGNFKAGSFKLATKANVPIVPIAIQNTYKVLEEKKKIQKTTIYVNVGKPIDVPSLSAEEKKKLPKHVEDIVRELLAEITD